MAKPNTASIRCPATGRPVWAGRLTMAIRTATARPSAQSFPGRRAGLAAMLVTDMARTFQQAALRPAWSMKRGATALIWVNQRPDRDCRAARLLTARGWTGAEAWH